MPRRDLLTDGLYFHIQLGNDVKKIYTGQSGMNFKADQMRKKGGYSIHHPPPRVHQLTGNRLFSWPVLPYHNVVAGRAQAKKRNNDQCIFPFLFCLRPALESSGWVLLMGYWMHVAWASRQKENIKKKLCVCRTRLINQRWDKSEWQVSHQRATCSDITR